MVNPITPSAALVAPSAGAWIEINLILQRAQYIVVAPSAGAWIEMFKANDRQCL